MNNFLKMPIPEQDEPVDLAAEIVDALERTGQRILATP